MPRPRVPPRTIVQSLASRHGGIVTRSQLIAHGVTASAIDALRAGGWLIVLYEGVYAVGHVPVARRSHFIAALAACGPGAVLSHETAAELWELGVVDLARVHVTTAIRTRRSTPALVVHRVRGLAEVEVGTCGQLAVTKVPRLLLDLADSLGDAEFERAIGQAKVRRLVTAESIADVVQRSPGRRGRRLLTAAGLIGPTRSELERRLQRLVRRVALPAPEMNAEVHGIEVDAYWPDRRLVIELDSYSWHDNARNFRTDRAKDRRLRRLGYTVLRFTWDELADGTAERELAALFTGWDTQTRPSAA